MKNLQPNKFYDVGEQLFNVENYIVGLWKFREAGKKSTWCTTYVFEGKYYDTFGKLTPQAALVQMRKDLDKLVKSKKGN